MRWIYKIYMMFIFVFPIYNPVEGCIASKFCYVRYLFILYGTVSAEEGLQNLISLIYWSKSMV